ncbi:MAG: hypothetical protein RL033_5606, partial [Pseudomonadota bacterium]
TEIYLGNAGMRINAKADGVLPYGNAGEAGDVNGDGLSDVLVGNVNDSTGGEQAGAAYVFLGAAGDTANLGLSWRFSG